MVILDTNNKEIKLGMTVTTQQESGGLFNPAPPKTGIVVMFQDQICVEYQKQYQGKTINCYISLYGKINTIL
jgi:hypothetical protein